jgi:hypothetical protein
MNAILISTVLTVLPLTGVIFDVGRADPPPAGGGAPNVAPRSTAASRQSARKQQARAIRTSRAAERRLARQIAVAQADGWWDVSDSIGSGGSVSASWGSGSSSAGGFSAGTGSFGSLFPSGSGTLTGSSSGTGQTTGDGQVSPIYNAKILEFALNHLGQQVGNGECWTLAAEALTSAGAKPAEGYVFGAVIPLSSTQPGDILQFESAVFAGLAYWMQMGFPHHTAIVDSVQGSSMVVLNQNFNNIRRVQTTLINFADMQSGSVTAYRAVPPNSSGGTVPAGN